MTETAAYYAACLINWFRGEPPPPPPSRMARAVANFMKLPTFTREACVRAHVAAKVRQNKPEPPKAA